MCCHINHSNSKHKKKERSYFSPSKACDYYIFRIIKMLLILLLICYNFYETLLSFLNNATHWTITFVCHHELSMTCSDTIRLFLFPVIAARSFYHSTRIYLGQRNTPLTCTRFLIRIIYYDNVCICDLFVAPRVGMRTICLPAIRLVVYLPISRERLHHYYPNKRVSFTRGRLTTPLFNRQLIRVIQ